MIRKLENAATIIYRAAVHSSWGNEVQAAHCFLAAAVKPPQMHETKHTTVPVYGDGADPQSGEPAPETQQLTEEGVAETKGEKSYNV